MGKEKKLNIIQMKNDSTNRKRGLKKMNQHQKEKSTNNVS